jgi:hypothetical protein
LSVALDDVGGDRKGGANQLAAERYKLSAPYPRCRAMHIERKRMGLPPNFEILEIAHAQGKREQLEIATSFRLEGHPMRRELQQEVAE